jgi:ankyrin repeat protein
MIKDKRTPLHYAVKRGHLDVVDLMLKANVKRDALDKVPVVYFTPVILSRDCVKIGPMICTYICLFVCLFFLNEKEKKCM